MENSSPATEHSSVALGLRTKLRFVNACPRPWNFSLEQYNEEEGKADWWLCWNGLKLEEPGV